MIESVELPSGHRRSASQLESFLTCGEAFRLERIEKAPQYPAAWLTQGIAFHGAIENWERGARAGTEADVVTWYEDAFDRTLAEQMAKEPDTRLWLTGGRKAGGQDIEDRLAKGRQQAIEYREWALATAGEWKVWEIFPGEFAVEVGFDIVINGVRIVGFIDQIIEWPDGQLTIRDLKTGTKLPDHARQLGVYRLAILKLFGIDIQWGDFFMSKNCAPTKPHNLTRYTEESLGRWFKSLDDAVTQGLFIPRPGDHCRVCSVERFCEIKGRESDVYSISKRAS